MIDIHQHLNFHGRSDEDLVQHQETMGAKLTVLLPSDDDDDLLVGCPGPEKAYQFALKNPNFLFASNAYRKDSNVQEVLASYLDKGAVLIGEIKFGEEHQHEFLKPYIEVAKQYNVPILLHFQNRFKGSRGWHSLGLNLNHFEDILRENPDVNFIAHAVSFWDEMEGLSDRLMTDYPNLFADTSAGSGHRAIHRPGAQKFLLNHHNKLLFGSDCQDPSHSKKHLIPYKRCLGHEVVETIKDLVPESVSEKIFNTNAKRLLKL